MSGQYIERWLTEFTTFKIPRDRTVMKPKTEDGRIWSVITELIKESIEVRTNNGYMGRVVESDSDVLLVTGETISIYQNFSLTSVQFGDHNKSWMTSICLQNTKTW